MARGRSTPAGRGAELLGLVAFALAALVTISLLSFDPLDRSFFAQSAARGVTRNLAGAVGANLAHLLLVLFGVLAYLVPVALVVFGVRRLRSVKPPLRTSLVVGAVLLVLAVSALAAVTVEQVSFRGTDGTRVRTVPVPAGGLVGQVVAAGLGAPLGKAGTLIVLLTTLAAALLLTTPISFARAFDRAVHAGRDVGERVRAGAGRWLERRKKEREKSRAVAREQATRAAQERAKQEAVARKTAEQARARAADEKSRAAEDRARAAEAKRVEDDERHKEEARERELAVAARQGALAAARRKPDGADAAEATNVRSRGPAAAAGDEPADRVLDAAQRRREARGARDVTAVPPPAAPQPGSAEAAASAASAASAAGMPARAPLAGEAARALARDAAARAAAATLRLAGVPAGSAGGDGDPGREAPSASLASTGNAAASTATGAGAAPAPPAAPERVVRAAAAGSEAQRAPRAPTPHDVAALAAEASGAMRRAREERAQADARKKPAGKSPAAANQDFSLPPLSLLETVSNDAVVTERELVENAKVLVSKLHEFAVEGTVQAIHPGPVVTTYEFRPEAGIKYSKIVGLADDLCLAMKAEGVRIDRISGKSAVGIEVPNSARETISLKEMLESEPFQKTGSKLTISLGKSINGEPYFTDLRKMPHLLVAGATGSGKSVAVNCMIVSILYKSHPEDVKFIMVDPKRIELGVYDGIPHLLVPVVTDCRLASNALRWAVVEMENRYKRLASTGVRSLEQYNAWVKGPEGKKAAETQTADELQPLPYIVILIDELADLMMVAANDVEDSISRLAAMARAVGIHLVLATQRPSVDVITGVIKANFPSRISFRVSSKVDSRTILDANGAEMLLGKGDMLFMPPGSARLQRVHGAFISDGEVQRLVNYLKNQRDPEYNDEILKSAPEGQEEFEGEMDEMYDEAVRVVIETGQASVSHLQRRLRLGYSRAARLVDMMELNGLVGPNQGAKGREILVDRAQFLAGLGR